MTQPLHEEDIQELRRRMEDAEETLRAIRNGEVDALVVNGDEGERVFTLQGADHAYRTLIEGIQQGAVSLTGDGTILYCNRCFAEMLHLPHERIVGAKVSDFLASSEREIFESLLKLGRKQSSQGELQFQSGHGKRLPVYLVIAPLPLANEMALCMVVTDLTEQKKHQSLQEVNRRKDEFLAMLAHELRNPLAPILNAVTILQNLGFTDERVIYANEIIERQVQHLSRLVDDLLDISRITLGKIKLQKEPLELTTILARAVEVSRPVIDARRHQLTISLPPKGVRVNGDPTRLTQIVGNLLTNAAKYTDEGGQIILSAEQEASEVIIRVRDNGMGIPKELLSHVFDLFIQGDRSLARSEGGLGIGLTLVRRLVEMHAGTVEARSDGLTKGSEFIVRLPLLAEEEQLDRLGTNAVAEKRGPASRTILIVEDNKDGADTLAMLLQLTGHRVRIAYNGAEALQLAATIVPEVVLLDIGLPAMSGYEVAERLRAMPELASVVLIAMTGYGQEEDRQKTHAAGFNHHLVKPVNIEVLKQLMP